MTHKLNIYTGIMLLALSLLSGCSSTPKITPPPLLSETEAFKYDEKLLAEYAQLKSNKPVKEHIVKWVQPANKKESCKVYTAKVNKLDDTFKIYWDGKCKNGYANGLGREFARNTLENMNAIALYKGGKKTPKYFHYAFNLKNHSVTGDILNNYAVRTKIKDNELVFHIESNSGYFGDYYGTFFTSSPFSEHVNYEKRMSNDFSYLFFRNNSETGNVLERMSMVDGANNTIGYSIERYRNGSVRHYEMTGSGNKIKRRVKLPISYIEKMLAVKSEIIENSVKAGIAEESANIAINQYMLTICRDSVSVDFIDNTEYKEICKNSKYKAKLRAKINAKFSEINQIKAERRRGAQQKKLTDARISQAHSAARAASAAEDASFSQSMQNMNQNTQMQSLNHNLFMMRMGL